jgi:polysaccharide export outer membrane protein
MKLFNAWIRIMCFAILCGTFFTSCLQHKQLVTLNGNDESIEDDLRDVGNVKYQGLQDYLPYLIQPFDQLLIKVNAFDGNTEDFLDKEFSAENTFSRDISYDPASLYFNSYSVDERGQITLPLIGAILVKGKTISDIKKEIDEAYKPHLKLVSTSVKLANMRITIFGEVNRPGVQYLYNERTTILDAISLAGDITDFGNRKKVKLIRLTDKGSKTVYLNLHKSDFIKSDFFYIKPYDVIYVEPTKAKSRDRSARVVGVVISAVSVGTLILNLILTSP